MKDETPAMSPQLVFEAGKVSFQKGWDSPDLISPSHVDELQPVGPPVILIASADQITAETARAVASLTGAGREASVVTDGPLQPEVASWLGDDMVVYPHASVRNITEETPSDDLDQEREDPEPVTDGDAAAATTMDAEVHLPDDGWLLPKPPDFPDPYCVLSDPARLRDLQESPVSLHFWNRFVAERGVNVTLQPPQSGVPTTWVGRWSLFEQQTDGCLVLYFRTGSLLVGGGWRGYVSVSSIIGHAPVRGSGLDQPHSEQQRQFANQVTAFCEISEAEAMVSRTMGGARWGNIQDLRGTQESAFGDVRRQSLPMRYLDLTHADTVLLVGPQGPVEAPLPGGLSAVTLTYLAPITDDAEKSAGVLAHSIDAITRTHRLLWNRSSDLDGRRNPEQAAPLQVFLDSVGLVSYGGAAEILWDTK